MKLEEQVCSLELAIKLKELGVPQDSLFWWYSTPENNGTITHQIHSQEDEHEYRDGVKVGGNVCSAFTVAELGEMLPEYLSIGGEPYILQAGKNYFIGGVMWYVGYMNKDAQYYNIINEKTEAEARAKMLISLKENW